MEKIRGWLVPFVDWGLHYQKYKEELDNAWKNVMERGDYIMRSDVEEFEKKLANLSGRKYAIGLNSGTDALFLSLKALGIGEGDEVITVSHTFIATIAAIYQTGATPVLVDVNENYVMDVNKVEDAITSKTKAIIPVHLGGRMVEMDRLMMIAEKHNLFVIEDACQCLNVKDTKGRMAGSYGITGCFSFYPSKVLGSCGDAGGVVMDNEEIYNKIRLLQDHGRKTKEETVCFGWNSRLDNLQAAILNVKLGHLLEVCKRKEEVCRKYNKAFRDIPEIILPPQEVMHENYVIRVEKRNELVQLLTDNLIETQVHEPVAYHKQGIECMPEPSLPFTERLANEVISLPLNPELNDEQIDYVIKKVREFYGKI